MSSFFVIYSSAIITAYFMEDMVNAVFTVIIFYRKNWVFICSGIAISFHSRWNKYVCVCSKNTPGITILSYGRHISIHSLKVIVWWNLRKLIRYRSITNRTKMVIKLTSGWPHTQTRTYSHEVSYNARDDVWTSLLTDEQ